ncbi:hypothetical protein T492DRAFT_988334 [Pavlovales sp. CCMP2436]|nr:hypothetical protein T492DRAFT_988334 [Pavlovales sp. CCMP2436]
MPEGGLVERGLSGERTRRARGEMPRRATHTHLEVPLRRDLGGGEGAQLRASLIEGLVKYLLFVRGQIPRQYDEVHTEHARAGDGRSPAKSTMASRRRGKCVDAAETAFASVRALSQAQAPDMAAVVVGHSPTLPKEVYVLRFAVAADEPPALDVQPDPAGTQASIRRLLRRLVVDVESQFEGVRRPMRTWVFVHLPNSEQAAALGESGTDDPPAFAPRPGFRIALNKSCHVVTIDIGLQEAFLPDVAAWPGVIVQAGRSVPPRLDGVSPFALEVDDGESGDAPGEAGGDDILLEEEEDAPSPTPPDHAHGLWLQSASLIAGFKPQ